ncbi:MAG: TPM domain-containing protein [Bdellovibrionia bacterium]
MVIQESDIKKIEDAVARAEEKTSGEIVPMIVRGSSVHGHVELLLAALLAIVALSFNWYFASIVEAHWWIGLAEAVVVLATVLTVGKTDWALRVLTPNADLYAQAFARAKNEFWGAGLQKTDGSTGVLLFVSKAEHWAVVLADKSIADKLPPETWKSVVDALIGGIKNGDIAKGYVDAIEKTGAILAEHFPIRPQDKNELPNKLILKD